MLVLNGCNHHRARNELQTQYSMGTLTDASYPVTEEAVITLFDSVPRGSGTSSNKTGNGNNDNNDNSEAVIAAHDIEYSSESEYEDDYSDEESIQSVEENETDKATLLTTVVEEAADKTNGEKDFKATILANAVTEYDEEIESIESNLLIVSITNKT
jgi:hypothetical protein